MKYTTLLSFTCFVLFCCAYDHSFARNAPAWLWAKAARGNAQSVTTDVDGNVYVAGTIIDSLIFEGVKVPGNGSIFIAKYDKDGTGLWIKRYGRLFSVNGINADGHNGMYITGTFSSDTIGGFSLQSNGGIDIYIARVDNTGSISWIESGGGAGNDDIYSKQPGVDKDGNVYISGSYEDSMSFGNIQIEAPTGGHAIYLAKYDKNGNIIWARSYDGPGNDNTLSITADENGNSYITGFYQNSLTIGANVLSAQNYSYFIAKHDKDGNVVWAKTLQQGFCTSLSVAVDKVGNVYTSGSFTESISIDNLQFSKQKNVDGFLLKHDKDGIAVWVKTFSEGNENEGRFVTVDIAGNVYVSGRAGILGGFITKYNTNGNLLWKRDSTTTGPGNAGVGSFDAISVNANGNVHTIGEYVGATKFDNIDMNLPYGNMAVAKLDVFPVHLEEVAGQSSNIRVYPNPAQQNLTIRSDKPYESISLYDVTGKLLYTKPVIDYKKERTLNISHLIPGVYFIRLSSEAGNMHAKFIKE